MSNIKCPYCDGSLSTETRFCDACQVEIPYGKAKVVPKPRLGYVQTKKERDEQLAASIAVESDSFESTEMYAVTDVSVADEISETNLPDVALAVESADETVSTEAEFTENNASQEVNETVKVTETATEDFVFCTVCGNKNPKGYAWCELCQAPIGEESHNDEVNKVEDVTLEEVSESDLTVEAVEAVEAVAGDVTEISADDYIVCAVCGAKNQKDFALCELCQSPLNVDVSLSEPEVNVYSEPVTEIKQESVSSVSAETFAETECPKCGGSIPPDCNFCITCGAVLEEVPAAVVEEIPVIENVDESVNKENVNSALENIETVSAKEKEICEKCGAEILDGYRFCITCGASVSEAVLSIDAVDDISFGETDEIVITDDSDVTFEEVSEIVTTEDVSVSFGETEEITVGEDSGISFGEDIEITFGDEPEINFGEVADITFENDAEIVIDSVTDEISFDATDAAQILEEAELQFGSEDVSDSVEVRCSVCGAEIPPEYNFCTVCGTSK